MPFHANQWQLLRASNQTTDLGKRSVLLQPSRVPTDDHRRRTLRDVADLSPASPAAAPGPRPEPEPHVPGLDAVTGTKPRPEPLDPPMLPFALGGAAAFAVATVVMLLADAPADWLRTCVAGLLLGIPGTITMLRHDADRRRRRALTHAEFTVTDPG